jgi:hypothetical protein
VINTAVNYLAVGVVSVAAFVLSSVYYAVFGRLRAAELGHDVPRRPAPWQVLAELLRNVVLALVLALLHVGWGGALLLWLAFPVVLLTGSVMWDRAPRRLAVVHAGDWLLKLLLMTLVLANWR